MVLGLRRLLRFMQFTGLKFYGFVVSMSMKVLHQGFKGFQGFQWVVVKIMVPFWVPIIIRHLLFRVPKKGP